jgi:hypothetical protein
MNRKLVDTITRALLYEGYLLYPYRPSAKNRQRWTFGGLYPPAYVRAQDGGSDASDMQTQCLASGGPHTRLTVAIRFLQLVARRVGVFDAPLTVWPGDDRLPAYHHVESFSRGDTVVSAWQEAIEREVALAPVDLGDLAASQRWVEFDFHPTSSLEPVHGPEGTIAAVIERDRMRLDGGAELATELVADGLYRVTVRVENRTHFESGAGSNERDRALLHSFVSTHTLLGVEDGGFVSLLEPPDAWRSLAEQCVNVGTWPVLVGEAGQTDTMLASPIILYDYPAIAPESPGDLFDATEIDEILTLRVLSLTDDEKRAVSALDARGRALLERTEALAREQLLGLHGTLRAVHPAAGPGGQP